MNSRYSRSIINVRWALDIMSITKQLLPKYTFTEVITVFMAIIHRLDESYIYFTVYFFQRETEKIK